ncbi:CRISPR-associated protein [Shewanella putrefaciens]|uniref:TIGR03986 family CRISPR-associated RAMP protein n=1 Tax=Shewanella decolorationis TaxID=256839 RepID=A0A5B8QY42_9GAMM|nr:TIGR03986 family CRISPR-associated RAMP protein [Shewanella decolorationis]QDZ90841.1 TIGR03986 family CRISPR-associated RAMP protein [Shewanella decolorationis]VEE64262.1 CRISPR-associated protein [Shewanella putrefaciens]
MSSQVHAPYHFAPLSSWVYMPEWAHLVSHDHPFEDSLSGVIEYELTNKTPLLVGGEQLRADNQPSKILWSRDPDGKPVIPGSSVKGMLRSVLEIASFAKFSMVDDHHFGFRDISNSDSRYAQKVLDRETETQTYWLKYDADRCQWMLRKCQHTVLFTDDFNQFSGLRFHNQSFKLPAKEKYEQWPLNKPAIPFELGTRTMMGTKGKPVTITCAQQLGTGKLAGVPVFTGSRPGKNEVKEQRLNFNYVFYAHEAEAKPLDNGAAKVTKMFAAHDEDLVNHLKKFGHPELGMPIFAKEKQGKIIAMGFAKMPKVLYDNSIGDIANKQQKPLNSQSVFDMPGLMFGTLAESGFSLKSRVAFSDASCSHNAGITLSKPVILGQPKASYLNAYLEQNAQSDRVRGELSQYENNSKLAGWKRYPAQSGFNAHLPADLARKTSVQSQLELMNPGSRFNGKLVFHNLKPVELGALLWVLNPDGDKRVFHHALGHGKSLGAGAVQFNAKITIAHSDLTPELNELRSLFVEHMNAVYPSSQPTASSWLLSPQIRHLLAFGDRGDNQNKDLSYMQLNSKDSQEITYTSSAKGREKLVLPAFCHQSDALGRNEQLKQSAPQLGRGRLYQLLEQLEKTDNISEFEREQLEQSKQAAEQAAKNALFAQASPQYREYLNIIDELTPYRNQSNVDADNKRQGMRGRIDSLLTNCLSNENEADETELQQICRFVFDFPFSGYIDPSIKRKDLSKKAKEKFDERKALVDALLGKCKLEAADI